MHHDRLDHGVHVLRLDRPEKRNALDSTTLAALVDALDEVAVDETARVLVLSTTSPTAFCAGADVGEQLDHDGGVARMAAFTRLYTALDAMPVPMIAVAVGNCVGAGAEIVAAADLRVGGDNLALAWAGARHGVPVGPARLVPLVGLARAKDLVLTGRTVGVEEAERLGLLQRAVPAADAERVALELADQLAARDPAGLRVLKQLFRELDGTARRVAYENDRLLDFQLHGTGLPRGGVTG
ncbi:enoyl-CoA hydratase/isomerase family protein [Jatrophihabitans endophyticus]|uniref:enoyl-CoA hydratase/isomerase family protein n=1 Tax=Jatrophihabitans endophyticus TaxID=1206085 RepID=UPI00093279C1|nr:enoyl-CoA hydratase/isomerase family protein [Jatrophihabitans endophyticus]